MKKGREKEGKEEKKEKSDKTHIKIPLSTKTGKNFRGGGEFSWLARIYTPVITFIVVLNFV